MRKKIKVQGFIIFDDFGLLYAEFATEMAAWIESGKIKYREEVIDGLENAQRLSSDFFEARTSASA